MKIIALAFFIIASVWACQPIEPDEKVSTSQGAETINLEGFKEPVKIEFAKNFSVYNYEGYKLAQIHYQSDERGLAFKQKIVFYPRGKSIPKVSEEHADAWMVQVPLQTVAANDDGEITRLKSLGLTDQIIAMGGGGIYDAELRQKWEAKEIASIGYSFHAGPKPEIVLALNPDLLLLYSFDHQRISGLNKLRELGINAIPHFAWAEPSFLGKAEWLKFTALFFNKEKEANQLFEQIVKRCQDLSQMVAAQSPKTSVFLTYFPSAESDWSVHRNDFYSSFLEAAGAENILKDNGPTHAVGMNNETLLSLANEADVWLGNSTTDKNWPPASYLNSFKSYREGKVYHYQKRTNYEDNAYDWYETPEVRPDLVLEDLIAIFYPDLLPDHQPLFFDKLKQTK